MNNKYQEALDNIIIWTRPNERTLHEEDYADLQELINKETPMIVINRMYEYPVTNRTKMVKGFECPNCHQRLHNRYKRPYCAECGQHLDWSEENE